jgi:hypothetical protein
MQNPKAVARQEYLDENGRFDALSQEILVYAGQAHS